MDNRLKPLLKNALVSGVCSGLALGIYAYNGGREKRSIISLGRSRNDGKGRKVTGNTFFDLASLTKPLCTVLGTCCLIQKKQLAWQTKVTDLVPYSLQPGLRTITVDQLLTHSAGLIAYKPLYALYKPVHRREIKEDLLCAFLAEKKAYDPGSACVYSDIGFMLLGTIIEQLSGMSLDEFFSSQVAAPIGVEDRVLFRRLPGNEGWGKEVAATEQCLWRQRLLQGEVHDEHAWLMNGVAGHAGLFGTITGVLAMVEYILHAWKGRTAHPGFSQEILEQALTKKYADRPWCRGFDTPAAQGSSAGSFFSEKSVGHLGYTGTSFWIDPEQEIVVVLLTNRVHPDRNNEGIKSFRPVLHDAVMEVLQEE